MLPVILFHHLCSYIGKRRFADSEKEYGLKFPGDSSAKCALHRQAEKKNGLQYVTKNREKGKVTPVGLESTFYFLFFFTLGIYMQ